MMINGFKKPFDNNLDMYVVVVGVHPDDAELCCGGSIAAFLGRGLDVLVVYITKGTAGIPDSCDLKTRIKESITACKILGVNERNIFFGDFEDTKVVNSVALIHFLESFVPDPAKVYAVMVPSRYELHQDHKATAQACDAAFRNIRMVLAYESPSTTAEFAPTAFCDITGFLKRKWRALRSHESQISQEKGYLDYNAMVHLVAFRGRQGRAKYAEAFEVLRSRV